MNSPTVPEQPVRASTLETGEIWRLAGPVVVANTHLSFVPGWNVAQLREIVRWARTLPGPRVLLGDLNLPGPVARLTSRWTPAGRLATYPSWKPRVQLDHVLLDGLPSTAQAFPALVS